MDDFTRKFNIATEKDAEIHQILSTVYRALEEKGYNPINQIVGYILSEDPTYITNHNNVAIINGGRAAILVKNNTLQVGSVAGTNQHIGANNSMFNVSHNM